MAKVFNYGGGRQSIAICVLIARGLLPRPDVIVIADTGRENQSTWDYLREVTNPYLSQHGLTVEIAPRELSKVDLYAHNGDLLLPVYTKTGKLPTFCSNEWKVRVVSRYLRAKGITGGEKWLGYGYEETRRWSKQNGKVDGKWVTRCPLVDLMLDTATCLDIVQKEGLPPPKHSSCWMCPHKRNAEWRDLRDNYPEQFAQAVALDKELREDDEHGGVFLHFSRVPLSEANIDIDESKDIVRQCTLGMCFV